MSALPNPLNDALALAAIEPVRAGMIVGLGTGRAAARGVRTLAAKAAAAKLDLTGVATSKATAELAASLGLRVVSLNEVSRVDYLFDGADEVSPDLAMIKGGGAAMTRERIVAHACIASGGACTYIIDETKQSSRLGERRLLPIEVIPLARRSVLRELLAMGLAEPAAPANVLRRVAPGQEPLITDNAGEVLDLVIPPTLAGDRSSLADLAKRIKLLTGVIDHGLFVTECRTLLVEDAQGRVTRLGA